MNPFIQIQGSSYFADPDVIIELVNPQGADWILPVDPSAPFRSVYLGFACYQDQFPGPVVTGAVGGRLEFRDGNQNEKPAVFDYRYRPLGVGATNHRLLDSKAVFCPAFTAQPLDIASTSRDEGRQRRYPLNPDPSLLYAGDSMLAPQDILGADLLKAVCTFPASYAGTVNRALAFTCAPWKIYAPGQSLKFEIAGYSPGTDAWRLGFVLGVRSSPVPW